MFGSLGAPELLIILAVVILIFGVGRISGLGRELGSSIKEFRRAVKDPDKEDNESAPPPAQVATTQVEQPQQQPPAPQQPPAAPAPSNESKNPNVF
jgi:sec-independent protein translocase protein TatA